MLQLFDKGSAACEHYDQKFLFAVTLNPSSNGSSASTRARNGVELFEVNVHQEPGAARVAPVGELDLATTPQLDQRLRELHEGGCNRFILDLRGLEFIDSSGIALLIRWDACARQNGIGFAVVDGPPAIRRVLELTGAADRLTFQSGS